MKSILAVCNTPLQIICALNLKNSVYKNDSFDIIISDHMNLSQIYVENIKKYKLFDNVYYAESFGLSRGEGITNKNLMSFIWGHTRLNIKTNNYIRTLLSQKSIYDVYLFNNIDHFSVCLYNYLWHKNKKIQAFLFEDGYSSYYAQGKLWEAMVKKITRKSYKIWNTLWRVHHLALNINGQYLYKPDAVEWDAPFERIKMNEIDCRDVGLINQLNQLFGYKREIFKQKMIFFEESFRREGFKTDDLELLEKIAEIVGKENILVKRHPRNNENLFNAAGFETIENMVVPWEIIVLNDPNITEKLLVSIGSGAVATPYTMFGMKTKSIVLLNLTKIKFDEIHKIYFEYMKKRVFEKSPEVFIMPKNEKELKTYFNNWQNKEKRNG